MIDFHYWPTPNGWKIAIALEEMELPYRMIPVDIGKGAQFEPAFLAISPNGRIPAIVDCDPAQGDPRSPRSEAQPSGVDPVGGPPIPVFESGAILIHLAEKSGRFLPRDPRGRAETLEWLMWQVGGFGPMLGQHGHFKLYAKDPIPYAIERYRREAERLYGVLDRRLAGRDYLAAGEYTIADMACWPWAVTYKAQEIDLAAFPNVRRWYDALKQRPALRRGYELGRELRGRR